jgi:hypothetical protein
VERQAEYGLAPDDQAPDEQEALDLRFVVHAILGPLYLTETATPGSVLANSVVRKRS